MASILIMNGSQQGDHYPLGRRTNVIGRDEALPIQVLDPQISRKHMRIRFDSEQDQYVAADLDSKHGVYINSKKLDEDTPLVEGDQIRLGKTFLLFTREEFPDKQSALNFFKKAGERLRGTLLDSRGE
ncbi:MAG: FHA domain-containing protein [Planctomycetes bacterium]|nr:FHA domain-containing protein [Planctomycetota bacterium]